MFKYALLFIVFILVGFAAIMIGAPPRNGVTVYPYQGTLTFDSKDSYDQFAHAITSSGGTIKGIPEKDTYPQSVPLHIQSVKPIAFSQDGYSGVLLGGNEQTLSIPMDSSDWALVGIGGFAFLLGIVGVILVIVDDEGRF